jgi:uncharacterized LabA/DUF88 family protein
LREPAVKHAIAFFDGQNLYQHAKEAFGHHHPNYDPIKLHKAVCHLKGWNPTLVRFYTGVPSPIESPMWAGYWSNRVLALKRAGVVVTTRPIRYRKQTIQLPDGTEKIVTTPQEKGVDIRLALDVVSLARKRQFDVAIIFSQDQDLAELVQELIDISGEQSRWIKIASAFPSGPNASAVRGIDKAEWIRMDQALYDGCLDSRDYRPKSTADYSVKVHPFTTP